jgi:hypothetical protein
VEYQGDGVKGEERNKQDRQKNQNFSPCVTGMTWNNKHHERADLATTRDARKTKRGARSKSSDAAAQ